MLNFMIVHKPAIMRRRRKKATITAIPILCCLRSSLNNSPNSPFLHTHERQCVHAAGPGGYLPCSAQQTPLIIFLLILLPGLSPWIILIAPMATKIFTAPSATSFHWDRVLYEKYFPEKSTPRSCFYAPATSAEHVTITALVHGIFILTTATRWFTTTA